MISRHFLPEHPDENGETTYFAKNDGNSQYERLRMALDSVRQLSLGAAKIVLRRDVRNLRCNPLLRHICIGQHVCKRWCPRTNVGHCKNPPHAQARG